MTDVIDRPATDFVELHDDVSASPLWNKDLAPTTIAQRTWSTWNIAALWIGMSVVITTYTIAGGMISDGVSRKATPQPLSLARFSGSSTRAQLSVGASSPRASLTFSTL